MKAGDYPGESFTYTYGLGRIAQHDANGAEYFLGDALGSVRQVVDGAGDVTLAQSYRPYGERFDGMGAGTTSYGFTGEWYDNQAGLVYLRARWYSPLFGRFMTKDPWGGNRLEPQTLNKWGYVEANPINRRDPSGMISKEEAPDADDIVEELNTIYGVRIKKDWGWSFILPVNSSSVHMFDCQSYWDEGNWRTLQELAWIRSGIVRMATGPTGLGGPEKIRSALGRQLTIVRLNMNISSFAPPGIWSSVFGGDMVIANDVGGDEHFTTGTVIHEFAHVWDYRSGNQLSMGLIQKLGTWICSGDECGWNPYAKYYDPYTDSVNYIDPETPPGTPLECAPSLFNYPDPNCQSYASTYGQTGSIFTGPGAEEWAVSFEAYVYPERMVRHEWTELVHGGVRESYVRERINSLP